MRNARPLELPGRLHFQDFSTILVSMIPKTIRLIAAAVFLTVFTTTALAQDHAYIPVGTARTKKTVLAFPAIQDASGRSDLTQAVFDTVTTDLTYMNLFRFLDKSAFVEDASHTGITLDRFKLTDWSSIGAEFLIKSAMVVDGSAMKVEVHLYDTFGGKEILGKRYIGGLEEAKTVGNTMANEIVTALTGEPGIFLTKIVMSCDLSRKKELYTMNFDGTDVRQVTHHNSIAFAPAWSADGTRIAYSLFVRHSGNIRNIDLYELNFNDNTIRMLSNRKGINSGAAYAPDGHKIALTMSFLGNPEIFSFNPESRTVTRLTKSFGFDVDPVWSPDGKTLAFVSSRTGMPMVFSMGADGSNVKRLTYAGRYNATPTWAPHGDKIAFAGWLDHHFDIFVMNSDGTKIERLSKDQGNNEDPYFSPDGNFIVFSSNRTGQRNVYVMNSDGSFARRLSYGLGNCVSPKWSSPPPAPRLTKTAHK